MPRIKGIYFCRFKTSVSPSIRKLSEGMEAFDRRIIPGFADDAVCLSGVESRTLVACAYSQEADFQSQVRGFYPAERARDMREALLPPLWTARRS